jgi:heme/copper-type cytochrome/quinol oxidase subunit 2
MKPGMHRSTNWSGAAVTVVALTAAGAVVAVAARSPLSRSSPVNAQAAQAPTIAVLVLLLGVGVVMLGLLMIVAWSGRRRNDDLPEPEAPAPEIPWWWKLLAMLLLFAFGAALVAAAISGVRRDGGIRTVGGLGLGPTLTGPAPGHQPAGGFTLPAWLPWTVLAIVVVAIAVVIVVLVIRRARFARAASDQAAAGAAVEAAIDALESDLDPRRAVIAAYGAMQRSLGEHGVARSPAEAPREYLQRVLLASRASEHESTTLTGLFEEARYSSHPISEHVREVALSALRSLQGHLRAEAIK